MTTNHSAAATCLVLVLTGSFLYATGKVTGTVVYDGPVPRMKPIRMGSDPVCEMKQEEPVRTEWLLAGENGELKNVFVFVDSGLVDTSFPIPEEPATINQEGCVYRPHVLGVQAGQPIDILNSDGTLHNVHALPKEPGNDRFNEAMPAARKKITKVFEVPEIMVRIKCDVHPWMGAFVGVVNHPFFAVTSADGSFEIPNLSPGTYTLKTWHEKLPPQTATVTIKEGETVSVDFTLKRPERPKKKK
ncbi:MAG: carboxypeptidase regulatory-like domain-containing protein [Fidelibacterota bacterium]